MVDKHEEAEEEETPKEEKKVAAEIKKDVAPAKMVEETRQEEEDIIDDWESATIDDMTKKIASKDIVPATAGGKALRLDEEDVDNEDLDTTISSKAKSTKETAKVKNAIKSSK